MEGSGLSAAMVTEKWLFNLTLRPLTFDAVAAPELLHSVRLYDLAADPACRFDVWEENVEITTAMRLSLLEWLRNADNHNWQDWKQQLSEEVTRELASLGYTSLDDEEPGGWFDETCACDWCGKFAK